MFSGLDTSTELATSAHSDSNVLTAAEKARGERYTLSTEGRAARYTRQRCGSEFGKLRSKSITAANREISDCFDRRCELDAESFARRVYDQNLIGETAKAMLAEGAEYLQLELKLSLADTKLDLEFTAHQTTNIAGGAGKWARTAGYATRIAGVLAGVAGVLAGAATLLGFAPEAIITKTAAFVLGIVVGGLSWLGEWLTRKGKKELEKARADAYAEAQRSVTATYDRIGEQIERCMDELLSLAGKEALTVPLQNATALWKLATEARVAEAHLAVAIEGLPAAVNAQRLLDETARTVASQRSSEPVEVGHVLLGEDWITDSAGLKADTGSAEPQRTRANDPGVLEKLFAGFRKFVFQFTSKVERGAGEKWLAETEEALATEEATAAALVELRAMLETGRSRYHLLGDYNTGKTSFIKRLLMDAGRPLPPTREVRGDPATDAVHAYKWDDVLLVDSPGLQSGRDRHDQSALEAAADASVLICLFQPNLLVGHTTALEQILKGDVSKGLAAKLGRTIFVIHRADELGPDPEVVPKLYAQACKNKCEELRQAFKSKGISVDLERIICMAADPRGRVGNRRDVNSSEFDPFREWDGFKEFHAAIRDIHGQSAATGLDHTLLEGGLARQGRIADKIEEESGTLWQMGKAFTSQLRVFDEITGGADLLEGDLMEQARKFVQDYPQSLRAQEAPEDDALKLKAERLAKWWEQPDFKEKADQWQSQAQKQIESWWKESAERLDRTLDSPRFKAAVACASARLDQSADEDDKLGWFKPFLDGLSKVLNGATRDVVYNVVKFFGGTFKPWGAVNLAGNIGRVGAGLGVLVALWDVVRIYESLRMEGRLKQRENELDEFINKSTEEVFKSLTQNGDDSQGPLEALGLLKRKLQNIGHALRSEQDKIQKNLQHFDARSRIIRERMNAAWTALGEKPTV